MFTRISGLTDICAARRPSAVHGYLIYALGIHENISRPWSNISCAIVRSSEKTSIDTPASPTNREIVCTIFLYSSISSRFESLCPDASSSLMCGFLAIKDGLVVCPSTNPSNSLTRRVSCGSPPSTNIFVLGRVIGILLSVLTSAAYIPGALFPSVARKLLCAGGHLRLLQQPPAFGSELFVAPSHD